MSSIQANQERRSIRVKDFLDDFRAGITDADMLKKYHLTPVGLEKFYNMLVEREIVSSSELEEHYRLESLRERQDTETSSFICPCCLASHEVMFDICPSCGVSFQELISRENVSSSEVSEAEEPVVEQECREESIKQESLADSPVPDTEIPPAAIVEPDEFLAPQMAREENDFLKSIETKSEAQNSLDDILPALDEMEQDHVDESRPRCDGCETVMHFGVRDMYDRARAKQALILAGILLFLGFCGSAAIGFFDGFSLVRLVTVYITGILFLLGSVFAGIAAFMFMAREKVFFCPSCTRIFPRA
jgi:hypothetical protein